MRSITIIPILSVAILGLFLPAEAQAQKEITELKIAAQKNKDEAERGVAKAQFELGITYHYGVQRNASEAVKWFRRAAEQGHSDAQYFLGNSYTVGEGVPDDDVEAVKWFRKAAEQGHSNAQYNLGLYYGGERFGRDENVRNDAESSRWFRMAAEQGHTEAQYYLGEALKGGFGLERNYKESAKWYREAAQKGMAAAQFQLGLIYANGSGVPKDYAEAYALLNLAGVDIAEAQQKRDFLEKEMPPNQIAEGQRRSQELQRLYIKPLR